MSSRRSQIEEAASSLHGPDNRSYGYKSFIAGADWADSTRQDYAAFRAETDEIITRLQSKLAVATEALEFYVSKDNRSARLIDQYEFIEKYFKREYIVDALATNYCIDNGEKASEALATIREEK